MWNQSIIRLMAPAMVIAAVVAATTDARARTVIWVGGNGAWENNMYWSDGSEHPTQPFDPDSVFIPAGTPVITFLEGMNTLDVDAGAGIAENGVLSVHNGVMNDGLITVGPDGQFVIDAGALAGGGVTVLTDSTGTNATLQGAPSGGNPCCVTQAATHTIRGEGTVTGKWINNGLIRAEETSGDALAVLTINGTMTNNGVIRSSTTGTVLLESMALTMGSTGQFIADTQSIQLSGATTITGGSIDAINGAKFVRRSDVGGTTVLSGVTINGDFDVLVNNAGVAGTGTGITNNGTMTIDNLGVGNGELSFTSGATLDGTGQVILNRANDNTHLSGTFTHGASHTIRGVGRIHANIVNNGSILAEPRNGDLLRVVGNAITNNNLLQANSGATLRFEEQVAVTQNATGRIRAANGGRVELVSVTVAGGKLQTAGTGLIVDTSASTLNNVTNEGAFDVQAGSTTRLNTSLTNNGIITVNPTGGASFTAIEADSATTLQGTGSIVLNNARVTSPAANETITQAAGHTIRGVGLIANGYFGNGKFINNGRLEGNSAAEPLRIITNLSGNGTLKNVQLGGDGFGISHTLGEVGTTAVVPAEGLYSFVGSNNSMRVDLAGTTPGTGYDQLNSIGPISLSPTSTRLEVSIVNGFLPSVGDKFTIATTTDTIAGTFGAAVLPANVPNYALTWKPVQYTGSSIILEVLSVAPLYGDYNANGTVDAADYVVWRKTFGQSVTMFSGADGDGNGMVGNNDFAVWRANFGTIAGSGSLINGTVPEPASAWLLIVGTVVAPWRGRRLLGMCH